ncbi:MAG: hypothetical protein HC828_06550 [Blastochloris sp.]|nr:hypothetical protein [Blastochloris sp.]
MPHRLTEYWDEEFSSSKMNCTDYVENYLLAQIESPIVLCLDECDRVFPYSEVAEGFLSLLRAWHEQAKMSQKWQSCA